jgi:hypothetical protein
MLKKIEQNADVLRGEMVAVKAPKKVREKYTHKGIFEQRGSTSLFPASMLTTNAHHSRACRNAAATCVWGKKSVCAPI